MPTSAIIKDTDFQLISEFAQPDAKKRLSLGEALQGATAYNIYRNPLGQLILDPVKTVPASEMWLYENPEALASVIGHKLWGRINMIRKINFTRAAAAQYAALDKSPSNAGLMQQVRKAVGHLEADPQHPSLNAHEFTSLSGIGGEKVFEAYAQNDTPGAYRIFWHYGPDEIKGKKRIPVITIIAITPHP